MDDTWWTPQLRQSVVAKLNDAIQASPGPSKSAIEMESHVFAKAKNKEQYLGFVARLILHVRELNTNKQAQAANDNTNQDPINALQNLANQGSRPPNVMGGGVGGMVPQGVVNSANMQQGMQGRGPMMGGAMNPQAMMNQMPVQAQMMGGGVPQQQQQQQVMNQMQPMQQMGMNANVMGGQGMGNMGGGQMGMGGVQQMPQVNQGMVGGGGPVAGGGVVNQMQNSPAGAAASQLNMMGQMGMGRKPQELMMSSPGNMFSPNVRSVTPNQFMRENPSPSVPSPANMGNPQAQMIPSPAMAQSPSPQMMGVNQRNMANVMAPSPGTSLNTPGQPGTVPSPMSAQEEALYKEKYRQLVKYIDPLTRMTAKMAHDKNNKATQKINALLEILSNKNQRMIPLETLIKCERALEQMNMGSNFSSGTGAAKEGSANPLLEAVSANLQNPIRNHTLQRTFKPCLDALFGNDLADMPPPPKQARVSQEHHAPSGSGAQPEIPHVLQGEIARLDQKFKINLDAASCPAGNKTIKLICCLDDKYLPCIPPISVTIPEDYPMVAPSCHMAKHEYNATPFLTSVESAFTSRVAKLPRIFSLTHLLDSWEMSVRQACSPKKIQETQCLMSLMLNV